MFIKKIEYFIDNFVLETNSKTQNKYMLGERERERREKRERREGQ